MTRNPSLSNLSDTQLLSLVRTLTARERLATADVIESLSEVEARHAYRGLGYRSLFVYCMNSLRLSEHEAYSRMEAARTVLVYPLALKLLRDGSITLTTITLLAKHLTARNHEEMLNAAIHKTKREVEGQVAALNPKADAPAIVRRLPVRAEARIASPQAAVAPLPRMTTDPLPPLSASTPAPPIAAPPKRHAPAVTPLAPERYKVQMTISQDTHDKLRRVQDLLRRSVPNGDTAVIFDRALTLLLEDLERKTFAGTPRPRVARDSATGSRHVPAAVKRAVWTRDGGQCAFVGSESRCPERTLLEYHHVTPFARGGPTTVDNLQLRCRTHNVYEAERAFGPFVLKEAAAAYLADSTRSGPS